MLTLRRLIDVTIDTTWHVSTTSNVQSTTLWLSLPFEHTYPKKDNELLLLVYHEEELLPS
jgi:hypothetical protein